jgi:hypothetical protein
MQINNDEVSILRIALLDKIDAINKQIEFSQRCNSVKSEFFWKDLLINHKALLEKLKYNM